MSDSARNELWQWAPDAAMTEGFFKQKWGADYTLAEIESGVDKVVTGLRRELVVPEDDEDSDAEEDEEAQDADEGDAMQVDDKGVASQGASDAAGSGAALDMPQMPLESVHRFMTTGKVG